MSVSTIIRSTKFAVIISTWYLSCDSRTKTVIIVSDNSPASAGRPNSASQKKFKIPQARTNAVLAVTVHSVATMMTNAIRWGSRTSVGRITPWRTKKSAAATRLYNDRTAARMTGARVPGPEPRQYIHPSARRAVIKLYLIRHDKRAGPGVVNLPHAGAKTGDQFLLRSSKARSLNQKGSRREPVLMPNPWINSCCGPPRPVL